MLKQLCLHGLPSHVQRRSWRRKLRFDVCFNRICVKRHLLQYVLNSLSDSHCCFQACASSIAHCSTCSSSSVCTACQATYNVEVGGGSCVSTCASTEYVSSGICYSMF